MIILADFEGLFPLFKSLFLQNCKAYGKNNFADFKFDLSSILVIDQNFYILTDITIQDITRQDNQ